MTDAAPDAAPDADARRDERSERARTRRRRDRWRRALDWRGERQPAIAWYVAVLASAFGVAHGLVQADASGLGATPTLVGLVCGIAIGAVLLGFVTPPIAVVALALGFFPALFVLGPTANGALPAAMLGAVSGVVLGAHVRALALGTGARPPRGPAARPDRVTLVLELAIPLAFVIVAILVLSRTIATTSEWLLLVAATLAWALPAGWFGRTTATRIEIGVWSGVLRFGVIVHALAFSVVDERGIGSLPLLLLGVFAVGVGTGVRQLLDVVRAPRRRTA